MKKFVTALFCAALATSAAAVTPPQYSQLRQDNPHIDDAIAAAPNSDLHGTFNRLSALYNRSHVRDAAADAGHLGLLPENFLRNLEATLLDLQVDISSGQLDDLTAEQALTILQLVEIYAVRRPLELWASNPPTTCAVLCAVPQQPEWQPDCAVCPYGDDDHPVIDAVQEVVRLTRDTITSLYAIVYRAVPEDDLASVAAPANLTAGNLSAALDEMLSLIRGVEIIDD